MRKRLALAMLLVVFSNGAPAEWVKFESSEKLGFDAYVDSVTTRRSGDMVTIGNLIDFKTIQTEGKHHYFSQKSQHELDCKNERIRLLNISWHSANMGMGNIVVAENEPDDWEPVPPRTILQSLWKFVCGKK